MEISNSNLTNLFACLSNINDKFENKIVKVQETIATNNYTKDEIDKIQENISQQIENLDIIIKDFSSTVDNKIDNKFENEITDQLQNKIDEKFDEKLNSVINSKLESNFDSFIDSKINDNNQIINKSISNINDNFKNVYSKDETNKIFLDKSLAENKFGEINSNQTKINELITNNRNELEAKINLKSDIENVYSKDDMNKLLENNYLNKSVIETEFGEINSNQTKINELITNNRNELEAKINLKSDIENVYSKDDIDDKLKLKVETSVLDNYLDSNSISTKLENYCLKSDLLNNINTKRIEFLNDKGNLVINTTSFSFPAGDSRIYFPAICLNSNFYILNDRAFTDKPISLYTNRGIEFNTNANGEIIDPTFQKTSLKNLVTSEMTTELKKQLISNNLMDNVCPTYRFCENNYAKTVDIDSVYETLDTKVNNNKSELQELINTNKSNINNLSKNKAENSIVNEHTSTLSNLSNILNFNDNSVSKVYSKDQINNLLNNKLDKLSDDEYVKLSMLNNNYPNNTELSNEINKVYSKEEINNKLDLKANSEDVYKKTEIDNKFTENQFDSDNYYTKTEVDSNISTVNGNFDNYYNKDYITENYYTKTQINSRVLSSREKKWVTHPNGTSPICPGKWNNYITMSSNEVLITDVPIDFSIVNTNPTEYYFNVYLLKFDFNIDVEGEKLTNFIDNKFIKYFVLKIDDGFHTINGWWTTDRTVIRSMYVYFTFIESALYVASNMSIYFVPKNTSSTISVRFSSPELTIRTKRVN